MRLRRPAFLCADCATGTPCVDHCRICTTPVNRDCPNHPDPMDDRLDEIFGKLEEQIDAAVARSSSAVAELNTLLREFRDEIRDAA